MKTGEGALICLTTTDPEDNKTKYQQVCALNSWEQTASE